MLSLITGSSELTKAFSPKVTLSKDEQSLKAPTPIFWIELGILIFLIAVPAKHEEPILSIWEVAKSIFI